MFSFTFEIFSGELLCSCLSDTMWRDSQDYCRIICFEDVFNYSEKCESIKTEWNCCIYIVSINCHILRKHCMSRVSQEDGFGCHAIENEYWKLLRSHNIFIFNTNFRHYQITSFRKNVPQFIILSEQSGINMLRPVQKGVKIILVAFSNAFSEIELFYCEFCSHGSNWQ